jgi:hypothetical protein
MNALDLVQRLRDQGLIRPTRVKDFKTSLQKLADACQVPLAELDLSAVATTYQDTLRTYFDTCSPTPSVYTQRNTFQNLGQIYRLVQPAAPPVRKRGGQAPLTRLGYRAARKAMKDTSPYKAYYNHPPYQAPIDQWPAEIVQQWERYKTSLAFEVKEKTLMTLDDMFSAYVGFNLTVERPPIERWDQVFESDRLLRFVAWHAKRVSSRSKQVVRTTELGVRLMDMIATLAGRQDRPGAVALRHLQRKLPKPPRMHRTLRPEHHFTLQELDAVGRQLMEEAKNPVRTQGRVKYHGLRAAIAYQNGLLVRLWIRVPMRSRSMREMDIDGRLYRDERGRWRLNYRGDQLKVNEVDGDMNIFTVPWPEDLTENLETYLREYRPRFPNASTSPYLFLNAEGRPFTQDGIWERFSVAIYQSTQKRIWPHLVRTIWADAYLDAHPGDWEGAAAMLNNTPQMVMKSYRRFRREQHLQKALDFNVKLFGNGLGKGTSRERLV